MEDKTLTWAELLEFLLELKVIDPERMKQSVQVADCGGADVYPKEILRDKQGNPYLSEL